jgi:hypothetical protein
MPANRRRPLCVMLFIAVFGVVAVLAWRRGWSPAVVPPADNAYVGRTREQVVGLLGAPDGRWPGHYGNPSLEWAEQYEPCETLTYSKWNGTLYVSVYPKDGQWVCFSSHWLRKVAAF